MANAKSPPTTWGENPDGTLHCTTCGVQSFPVGRSCKCPRPIAVAAPEPKKRRHVGKVKRAPFTVDSVMRAMSALDKQQARHVAACHKAARENVPVEEITPDGKKRTKFVRAWEADHSRLRMVRAALESRRKSLVAMHQMAVEREMPEWVERGEALQEALERASRRGRRSHEVEADDTSDGDDAGTGTVQ